MDIRVHPKTNVKYPKNKSMKKCLLILLLASFGVISYAQSPVIIEHVKILDGKTKEALAYYENNWKMLRDVAIERGYIASYQLIQVNNSDDYDLILMTTFEDADQLAAAEDNFKEIIGEYLPDGPKLMNNITPEAFRQTLHADESEILFRNK